MRALAVSTSRVVIGGSFNAAHYPLGSSVAATYSCTDPDPVVDVTCSGPVAAGAPIDTATAGAKTFKVDVVDAGGNASSQTVSYVVDPAPPGGSTPPRDVTAPVLSALRISPAKFRAAGRGAPFARAAKRARIGGRVTYRLSEAARVTFTIIRPKKGARRAKAMGRFRVAGKAGANRLTLRGRAAAKKLGVGAYRLEARAADAAGDRSRVASKAFGIVR